MKFDLHIHSRFSPDSFSCPKGILQRALELGYGLIAITDHDSNAEAFDWLMEEGVLTPMGVLIPEWAGRMGFPNAILRVLPGQEITTATGHLLALSSRLEPCPGLPAERVIEKVHQGGGLAIAAHPYDRWRACFKAEELETLHFDAIEVFNGGATNSRVNQLAGDLARRRGLCGFANSDGHTLGEIGRCHSEIEFQLTDKITQLLATHICLQASSIQPRVRQEAVITSCDVSLLR